MSSLTPSLKFLLDENVKRKLLQFLTAGGFDVKIPPKESTDLEIAKISKKENRVLVTNDEDFIYYTSDQVNGVIWLRVPQSDSESLVISFDKMLKKIKTFSGKLIMLYKDHWDEFPLGEELATEGKFRVVVRKIIG